MKDCDLEEYLEEKIIPSLLDLKSKGVGIAHFIINDGDRDFIGIAKVLYKKLIDRHLNASIIVNINRESVNTVACWFAIYFFKNGLTDIRLKDFETREETIVNI